MAFLECLSLFAAVITTYFVQTKPAKHRASVHSQDGCPVDCATFSKDYRVLVSGSEWFAMPNVSTTVIKSTSLTNLTGLQVAPSASIISDTNKNSPLSSTSAWSLQQSPISRDWVTMYFNMCANTTSTHRTCCCRHLGHDETSP